MVWLVLALLLVSGCQRRQPSLDQLYQQAWADLRSGKLEQASNSLARSSAKWNNQPTSEVSWKLRLLEAEILLAQGKAQQGLAILTQSGPDAAQYPALNVRRRLDTCDALTKLGRYADATQALDNATKAMEKRTPAELVVQGETLRGVILARTEKFQEAQHVLRTALEHAIEQQNTYYEAAVLINLAFCELRQFRFDAAAGYGEQAVAAGEAAGAKRLIAGASLNLGLSYARLGDFDRAINLTQKAARALEEINDRANLIESLGEIGNLNGLQGHHEESIASFKRAFQLANEMKLLPSAAAWATNIATELIATNHLEEAEEWNATAIDLSSRSRTQRLIPALVANTADIQTVRKQYDQAIETCSAGLKRAADYPDVQWVFHAKLGDLYRLSKRDEDANRHFEAALSLIEAKRSQLTRNEFKITYLTTLLRFYENYINALVAENRQARALEIAESSRARVLAGTLEEGHTAPGTLVTQYTALARRTGAVFLSYWLGRNASLLWVVTGHGVRVIQLPSRDTIAKSIASYRRLIEESVKDPLTTENGLGASLYQTLLGDAARDIRKGGHVVIVPDGPLHQFNFETLPVPGDQPHYWIEDVTLAIAPSLNVIALGGKLSRSGPASLLLIGDPAPAAPEFPALPNARREIDSIQLHFNGHEKLVYTGASAVPGIYRQSNPEHFSLIHFTAHADANRQSPLDSAVVLSPQGDQYKLYARDIVDLPLRAELVTVSACRSAGARSYEGEGLVGFAWAFLRAGARTVIAGLWDVSDSSTAMLMDRLYARVALGDSPVDALRTAKLSLLHSQTNYRKPYYWAPFQAYVREIR